MLKLRRMAGRVRRGFAAWHRRARQMWPIRLRLWRQGLPPLAPGPLPLDDGEFRADHLFLARQARALGPVFKTTISGEMVTCIVDHRRSRAALTGNEAQLAAPQSPYSALVPGGFLRTLAGEPHRRLRRVFVHALRPALVDAHEDALRALARDALGAIAARGVAAGPGDLVAALERIATGMLIVVCLGVRPGDPAFAALGDLYARLGPREFVWNPEDAQRAASTELMAAVRALAGAGADLRPSVLQAIVQDEGADALTDPVVGNLAYMVEMGRYDLRSLFRWIVAYLGGDASVVAALRAERPPARGAIGLAAATVMETLRLDQSEGVIRKVTADIAFEDKTIPAGSFLRACMREGHRDPAAFAEPERFDPSRFLAQDYGGAYAPFGFDHHICLAADLVIRLGAIFVETLARDFDWQVTGDGPRVRGSYHWEPSPDLAIRVTPRPA